MTNIITPLKSRITIRKNEFKKACSNEVDYRMLSLYQLHQVELNEQDGSFSTIISISYLANNDFFYFLNWY